MTVESGPIEAERQFFAALLAANGDALESVLADDFTLIDVMTGAEVPKALLRHLVGSGKLTFQSIEAAEPRLRLYQTAAVITGRARMHAQFEGTPFTAHSSYTNVLIEQHGRWRLVASQGTQLLDEG
jgi:hypothetical protein